MVASMFKFKKKETYIWGRGTLKKCSYQVIVRGFLFCFPNFQECESFTFILKRNKFIILNK